MGRSIVVGATSFIGIALVKTLLVRGETVFAIIRPNSERKACIPTDPNVIVLEVELRDLSQAQIPDGLDCDCLYYIGWSSDFASPRFNLEGQMQNVDYLKNAIVLAKNTGCRTFEGIGSQAECGIVAGCITPDTPENPMTAYAKAKVQAYYSGLALCESYGIKFCWPRLLSAYGPYDRAHTLIMSCLRASLHGEELSLTAGSQIWDYIYVEDVAEALMVIAASGKHGKRYPIGSGIGRSLISYIVDIADITENKNLLKGFGKQPFAENQVMSLVSDNYDILLDTGFRPQVDFTDGIVATFDYVKARWC